MRLKEANERYAEMEKEQEERVKRLEKRLSESQSAMRASVLQKAQKSSENTPAPSTPVNIPTPSSRSKSRRRKSLMPLAASEIPQALHASTQLKNAVEGEQVGSTLAATLSAREALYWRNRCLSRTMNTLPGLSESFQRSANTARRLARN